MSAWDGRLRGSEYNRGAGGFLKRQKNVGAVYKTRTTTCSVCSDILINAQLTAK